MTIGQQQNRPVTAFSYTVDAITGIISTVDNFSALGDHTNGTYLAVALGGGSGAGATADVVVEAGDVTSVTIVDGGTGYADTDTGLTIPNGTIGGAANATCDVLAVVGEAATVTAAGGTGWLTGDVISADELTSSAGVGTGLTGTVTATAGVVDGFVIVNGGTGYVAATDAGDYSGSGEIGISDVRYYDHDEYELGGDVQEYTITDDAYPKSSYTPDPRTETLAAGTFVGDPSTDPTLESALRQDDNSSTVKIVTKADLPQWQVQQRDIDGGAITVFAEPTIVSADGEVIGNVLRFEDITDEARCTAAGGTWTTAATGDGGTGTYGYCMDVVAFSANMDKTQCISQGYLFDPVLDECVNADGTDVAVVEAYLNGGAGDLYTVAQKTAICLVQGDNDADGFIYTGTACVIDDDVVVDYGTVTTQAACAALAVPGVWIAGTCYSPTDFGNGQGGDFAEDAGSQNEFPFSTKGK